MQLAKEVVTSYLDTNPIVPRKMYALEQLALIYELNGEKEQAELIREEAQKLDPYIKPGELRWEDLYIPPEEVVVSTIN